MFSPHSLSPLPWMLCAIPGALYVSLGASDPVFWASLAITLIVHALHHRFLHQRSVEAGGPLYGAVVGFLCVLIWLASVFFGFELPGKFGKTYDPAFLLPTGALQMCLAGVRWAWAKVPSSQP